MITVTERAKKELEAILLANMRDSDEGLRFLPSADGTLVLALGAELPGDQVVEYQGSKVLLVGVEYFKILDGKTLDCCDIEGKTVLVVR